MTVSKEDMHEFDLYGVTDASREDIFAEGLADGITGEENYDAAVSYGNQGEIESYTNGVEVADDRYASIADLDEI